jgi:hypothetical protein
MVGTRFAARVELDTRSVAWKATWYLLVSRRLYRGPRWVRTLAAWGLAVCGSIGYTPRTCALEDRLRERAVSR